MSEKAQIISSSKESLVNPYTDFLQIDPAGGKTQIYTKYKVYSQEIYLSGLQTYFVPEVFGRTLHAGIQVRDMNEFFHASFLTYLCDRLRNIYKFIFKFEVSKARQNSNVTLRAINNSCQSVKNQLLHII